MTTASTQADVDAAMSSAMEGIKDQLSELLEQMSNLSNSTEDRGTKLDSLEGSVDRSGKTLGEMEGVITYLEEQLAETSKEMANLDEEYEQMMTEQGRLDERGHQLYQIMQVQDQQLGEMKTLDQQQERELIRARFLRDDMRDALERKEDELKFAQRHLDQQTLQFSKQFEELKHDIRRQRQQSRPLLDDLESCNGKTLTRINFFTTSSTTSPEDALKAERLKSFIEYTAKHRTLFDEVGDMEFEVRNSERALEFSQAQYKAKLSKMEALEKELDSMVGVFNVDGGHFLKSAPRRADLSRSQEPEQDVDFLSEEEEEIHVGGFGIHKCPKIMDIMNLQMEEEQTKAEIEVTDVIRQEQEDDQEAGLDEDGEGEEEETMGPTEQEATKEQQQEVSEELNEMDMLKLKMQQKEALSKAQETTSSEPETSGQTPTRLGFTEEATASAKHLSSMSRGPVALSRDSKSGFLSSSNKVGLRSTGSTKTFQQQQQGGRKQR